MLGAIAVRLSTEPNQLSGIWHFSNVGPTTWHGFATEIIAQGKARSSPAPAVDPIATSGAYPTPARRPANSLLNTVMLTRVFSIVPRP